MALLLTFITGLFFLVGIILSKITNKNKNFNVLSIGLTFVVLFNLIFFDIAPEVFEKFSFYNLIFVILGIFLLKIMDLFIPHHEHHHKEKNDNIVEHEEHLEHISIVTILALILHNLIECMALYNIAKSDIKAGIMMTIAIALHNLPLGFQIGSSIKNNKIVYAVILTLSGFLGGLLCLTIGNISEIFARYILSFTLGMLIYLEIFELLKEFYESRKNKYLFYGIIIGIIIVIISISI